MEKIRIEVEVEDQPETRTIEIEPVGHGAIVAKVRDVGALGDGHVFERDKDDEVGAEIEKKKALSLLLHRCVKVAVKIRYEHQTKPHEFPPSATVFRVLQWAIGKKGFNLDDTAKAKANLMLPGADAPLPKDAMIGRYVKHGQCELVLDLTLKDFTNG